MEQNRETQDKLTHIWSINSQQRSQEYTTGNLQSLINALGSSGQPCKGIKLGHLYNTQKLTQNRLKNKT